MKYIANNYAFQYKFDFEIGHFIKSPCKACESRQHFPECLDDCQLLDSIHDMLSEVVSCSRRS